MEYREGMMKVVFVLSGGKLVYPERLLEWGMQGSEGGLLLIVMLCFTIFDFNYAILINSNTGIFRIN